MSWYLFKPGPDRVGTSSLLSISWLPASVINVMVSLLAGIITVTAILLVSIINVIAVVQMR